MFRKFSTAFIEKLFKSTKVVEWEVTVKGVVNIALTPEIFVNVAVNFLATVHRKRFRDGKERPSFDFVDTFPADYD